MYEQLVSGGIPVAKLVTLVLDGPNVNKTIFRKMDELIRHDNPEFTGLVDLGSCSIHTIHNVKSEEAMDELDEIRKRRKSLDKSTHKLLDQALPSKEKQKKT